MSTPSSYDDAVSPPLGGRPSAQSVLERLWVTQSAGRPRGRAARILGASPLSRQSRPWFAGALGEIEVGERLRHLSTSGRAWRVLHSVPLGCGFSDIDHVVVGRAGVFSLHVANHPGTTIRVGEGTVLVDGQATTTLLDARREAERAGQLLGAALGSPVRVRPVVVVVGGSAPVIGTRPPDDVPVDDVPPDDVPVVDVPVVDASGLIRHLRRQAAVFSVDDVRDLTRAALKPRAWGPRATAIAPQRDSPCGEDPSAGSLQTLPAPVPSSVVLLPWFARLRAEVGRARRVRVLWAALVVVVVVLAVIAITGVLQGVFG